ncbi:MAG: cyclic nucleotide-binding domain-containing protein, partial [Myxococcota bacterium]|nr:cyclic nucleotide-binding domain-containing protein [Myxococcota bacterium]
STVPPTTTVADGHEQHDGFDENPFAIGFPLEPCLRDALGDACAESSMRRKALLRGLTEILQGANRIIYEQGQEVPSQRGMGTTAVVLYIDGSDGIVSHVGDSRLYLCREGQLYQVTEDHSLISHLYKQGRITREEMWEHPQRNVILRCIGVQGSVEPDTVYLELFPGDRLLLCSDGLSDLVPPEDLLGLINSEPGQGVVDAAIDAANERGGKDNVTALLVEVCPDSPVVWQGLGMVRKREVLRELYLFSSLTDQECIKVNRDLYQREVASGETVLREGDLGAELYMVVRGRVDVRRRGVSLGDIGPGGHFGEFSLVSQAPRSATVIALEDTTLLSLKQEDFDELIASDPVLGTKVLRALVNNLAEVVRSMNERVRAE